MDTTLEREYGFRVPGIILKLHTLKMLRTGQITGSARAVTPQARRKLRTGQVDLLISCSQHHKLEGRK